MVAADKGDLLGSFLCGNGNGGFCHIGNCHQTGIAESAVQYVKKRGIAGHTVLHGEIGTVTETDGGVLMETVKEDGFLVNAAFLRNHFSQGSGGGKHNVNDVGGVDQRRFFPIVDGKNAKLQGIQRSVGKSFLGIACQGASEGGSNINSGKTC